MSDENYTTSFLVDRTPEQAFNAIVDPRAWWSRAIEGDTDKPGAVFYYHYQNLHRCVLKTTESVPGKKVVWHVLHNDFNFTEDETEWTGTDIVFEITRRGAQTEVRFTHVGLVPAYECYSICSDAWGTYVRGSLRDLIATGEGAPNPIEEIVTRVRGNARAA
jgi:hypothetical protein